MINNGDITKTYKNQEKGEENFETMVLTNEKTRSHKSELGSRSTNMGIPLLNMLLVA